LTANVYTDVPALSLHSEMAKLPWITEAKPSAQIDAQKSGAAGLSVSLPDILQPLNEFLQLARDQEKDTRCHFLTPGALLSKVAAQAGIEPNAAFLQACLATALCAFPESGDTQLRTQDLAALREIVAAWPSLPPELRTACLAVTRAAGAT